MTKIITLIIALVLSVLALIALLLAYGNWRESEGVRVTKMTYDAALAKQKKEAAALLANETAKTKISEEALSNLKNLRELQDVENQKTVAGLSARLRDLAGPTERLRDPHAAGCGCGGRGATGQAAGADVDRADNGADAGGLVSQPLTDLLFKITDNAEQINLAYISCRADSVSTRAISAGP